MEYDVAKLTKQFKALGDLTRVNIVNYLSQGEKCACMLLEDFDISQPTLSHHMKILCDSGLVIGQKRGKWMYYSLSDEGFDFVTSYLCDLGLKIAATKGTKCCDGRCQ